MKAYVKLALVSTAVLVCVLAATFAYRRLKQSAATRDADAGRHELEVQLSQAKSEGIAFTKEAYEAKYALVGENAWPLYAAAGKQQTAIVDANRDLYKLAEPMTSGEPDPQAVAKLARLLAPVYAKIQQAGKLASCRPPWDAAGGMADFEIGANFKALTKGALLAAEAEVRQGNPADALRLIATDERLCAHVAQAPGMVNALVWAAVDHFFEHEIVSILSRYGRQNGVAEAAAKALNALGPVPSTEAVAEAEAITVLGSFKILDAAASSDASAAMGDADPDSQKLVRVQRLLKVPGMIDRWKALAVQNTRTLIGRIRSDKGDLLALKLALQQDEKEQPAFNDDLHAYQAMIGPSPMSQYVDLVAYVVMQRRILRQAAAILATAAAPDRLPLGGDDALDPTSDKPLHYVVHGKTFTISGEGVASSKTGQNEMKNFQFSFTYPG